MMSDIPPTLQDRLKPLFIKKDDYAEKLCRNGKEIRRVQLELMKPEGASKETLLRSQRLIEETAYLTAKLRALDREIDGVLTQEMLMTAGCPEGAASAEQIFDLRPKYLTAKLRALEREMLVTEGEKAEG